MNNISKRLQSIIKKELEGNIFPVQTDDGILVGNVLIISDGTSKSIVKNGEVIFADIHLNSATIAIANLAALRKMRTAAIMYKADQDYSRAFVESQLLRNQYEKAINNNEYFKSDVLWARYLEARDRTHYFKKKAEALIAQKINK